MFFRFKTHARRQDLTSRTSSTGDNIEMLYSLPEIVSFRGFAFRFKTLMKHSHVGVLGVRYRRVILCTETTGV